MKQPLDQKLQKQSSTSNSVLKSVQIVDVTGQTLKLDEIQDGVCLVNMSDTVQVEYAPLSTSKSLSQ